MVAIIKRAHHGDDEDGNDKTDGGGVGDDVPDGDEDGDDEGDDDDN